MNLKHKKIDLSGLDIEIDIEAAKGFIDHRIEKKSPATQREKPLVAILEQRTTMPCKSTVRTMSPPI